MGHERDMEFQNVYVKFQAPLRTIARNCGVSLNDIDDVVQEAFASYYQNYVLQDVEIFSVKAVLTMIVKRKCVDWYRKNRHFTFIGLETEDGEIPTDVLLRCISKDVAEVVLDRERYRAIRAAIESLKPAWRDVIYCCCVLGYAPHEASEILGISGTACRSRLMRARIYLRKILDPEYVPQLAE